MACRHRRHQHRSQPSARAFDGSLSGWNTLQDQLPVTGHQHQGVQRGHPSERDESPRQPGIVKGKPRPARANTPPVSASGVATHTTRVRRHEPTARKTSPMTASATNGTRMVSRARATFQLLEVSAKLHAIARLRRHRPGDGPTGGAHETFHVAPVHVDQHDAAALSVLVREPVEPGHVDHRRHLLEGQHERPFGGAQRQLREHGRVVAVGVGKAYRERKELPRPGPPGRLPRRHRRSAKRG